MFYMNAAICVLLMAAIVVEILYILRRNRRINVKGKDDLFATALVMLFVMIIFPLTENATVIESLRNILLLVVMFATFAIRRGISEKGVEKLFFTVPWEKITKITITQGQTGKVQAVFHMGTFKIKLIFSVYNLKMVVFESQKHVSEVYLQDSLQSAI